MLPLANTARDVAVSAWSAPIHFEITRFGEIDQRKWDQLFLDSRSKNLFYDYRTIKAAQLIWDRYRSLKVVSGYRADSLVFVQPIQLNRSRMLTRLELLAIPTADFIEPLARASDWEYVTQRFLEFLSARIAPDLIVARSVSRRLYSLLRSCLDKASFEVQRVQEGSILHLPLTVEEYWNSLASRHRNQLKRKINKAEASGFRFRILSSGEPTAGHDLVAALSRLTRLHQLRFDSMTRASFFVKDEMQRFHWALCQSQPGSPVSFIFTEAMLDGEVVGSIYGMNSDEIYVYLMIGFDPSFASYSIGNVLIYRTIEHLIANQIKVFDFKCGNEPYKKWWTKDCYEKYDLDVYLNKKGRLLHTMRQLARLARTARRIPGKMRSIIKTGSR